MEDPFKITKIRKSVWDRLHAFRVFLDGGKVRQYRKKWDTSLSDAVGVLLGVWDEMEKAGWKISRETGKWGWDYTGEITLIPPKDDQEEEKVFDPTAEMKPEDQAIDEVENDP